MCSFVKQKKQRDPPKTCLFQKEKNRPHGKKLTLNHLLIESVSKSTIYEILNHCDSSRSASERKSSNRPPKIFTQKAQSSLQRLVSQEYLKESGMVAFVLFSKCSLYFGSLRICSLSHLFSFRKSSFWSLSGKSRVCSLISQSSITSLL